MLIHLVQIYSEVTGVSFRLEKCHQIVAKRGKVVKIDEVELPAGHIADIQTAVVIYVAVPTASNIRKKYENLEKYQGLKRIWKIKAKVVSVMVGTLRDCDC